MKRHSSLYLYLVIAVSWLLSSCSPVLYADASLHGAKRLYKGQSYQTRKVDKDDFGINFSAMFFAGMSGFTKAKADKKKSKSGFIYSNPEELYTSVYTHSVNEAGCAGGSVSAAQMSAGYFDLFTGLEFVMKNSKDQDVKINASYLEVPVYGVYVQPLKSGGKVFGGLGPYFAYGIGGKTKGDGFSEKTFDKEFGFKRFDVGLGATAGYMFPSGIYARLGYDYGLADIDRIDVDHTKNRSFSINFGFPIGNLIKKK